MGLMSKVAHVNFPLYSESNGQLSVYEVDKGVPFLPSRIFTVSAAKGDVRGDHAHKKCSQLLICVHGEIHVTCDDGGALTEHTLNSINYGLLIPPGVWATEAYLTDGAKLVVLCDRVYESDDYIRSYPEFKKYIEDQYWS
jgi:dTDP-4-dehydrorhamnose 3,5-epimerase-like enzyme